ncbi:MAG: methyltransferase [Bacilli bacterium]
MSYYFTNDDNLKSDIKLTHAKINNLSFSFYTDNGVFSKKGLDFGTRTLLETIPPLKGDILDLGCGYGPIGIYIATFNKIVVDMIDINLKSLTLARKNALENKVNVNIFESDAYTLINKKYDYIITNPPIRVGKKILYNLLFTAKNYLKDDGQLWLVISKDQGAKSLINDLEKAYQVEVKNKNKGFYVIMCKNN